MSTPTTASLSNAGNIRLSWWNRLAYGCGDTACNIVCGMINALLTLFYTDYVGIPIATVGLVMLLSRGCSGWLSHMFCARLRCLPFRKHPQPSSSGISLLPITCAQQYAIRQSMYRMEPCQL